MARRSNWLWPTLVQLRSPSFLTGRSNIAGWFQIRHLCSFVYIIVEQGKEKEDYIKSELIGGGSLKYLNNFSYFILIVLLAIHSTHTN